MIALDIIVLWLVAQAAVTDLALRKIPNVLTVSGMLIACVLQAMNGTVAQWLSIWLAGLLAGFFLFLPLYLLRAMAAGDVKLMAMVGAFLGPLAAVHVALLAYLAGGVMALLMLLWSGRWRDAARNVAAVLKPGCARLLGVPLVPVPRTAIASVGGMPYGVAIALATAAVLAWRHG